MTKGEPLWVVGYGSLIFKPPPHTKYVVPGTIQGFARRFWQSSSDHRGTPEYKGRVVTLVPFEDIMEHEEIKQDVLKYDFGDGGRALTRATDLEVAACACYIPAEFSDEVREHLDIREQDGYTMHEIPFLIDYESQVNGAGAEEELSNAIMELPVDEATGKHILRSKVYIGTLDNVSFVGPEPIEETAKVISKAVGPSGENYEYLSKLFSSVVKIDKKVDNYLFKLLEAVDGLRSQAAVQTEVPSC